MPSIPNARASVPFAFCGFVFGGMTVTAVAFSWANIAAALSPGLLIILIAFGLIPAVHACIFCMTGLSMGLGASKVPVVASFETVPTVLVAVLFYGEGAGPIKVMGICRMLLAFFRHGHGLRAPSRK